MSSTTYNDKTKKVGITLPNSLIKQTDKLRGDVKRSTYIRRAVEYSLKQIIIDKIASECRLPLRTTASANQNVYKSNATLI
jgi:hypothetical protein